MRREIRNAGSVEEKLKYVFEHAKRIQEPGYTPDQIFIVLREIVDVIRELEIVVKRPGGSGLGKAISGAAKAGVQILLGAAIEAGTSAVGEAIGQVWKSAGKKAGKKTAAKKAGKKTAKKAGKKTAKKAV